MKVRERLSGVVFDVYGIHWLGGKTYFSCFAKQSFGLTAYKEEEVEIVEKSLGKDFVFFGAGERVKGVFHKYLIEARLLDDLYEHDPEAYSKFVALLGHEP